MEVPDGWSDESLKGLWRVLPKALVWIEESFPGSVAPLASASAPAPASASASLSLTSASLSTKYVVFTGVRDKNLEKKLLESGWDIQAAVTSKTNVLVVADGELKESGKTKKATDLGVPIQKISEFRSSLG